MKILDITPISDTSQMPIIKGTLQFLQDAHKETVANAVIALIGSGYSSSSVYILWGCVNSGSGNSFNISAGAVFYNGEVFAVDAAVFTKTSGQVAIANIVTSQYTTNADPVTLSDSTVVNIHNIRKVAIMAGTSGAGIADFQDFLPIVYVTPSQVLLKGGTTSFTPTISTDPATKAYVDASVVSNILAKGTYPIGDISSGAPNVKTVTFSTLPNTNYMVVGTMVSTDITKYSSTIGWCIQSKTTSSFDIQISEFAGTVQALSFEWYIISK
jgi:hypothetical protein